MNKTAKANPPKRRRRTTDHDFLWKGFLHFFLRAFILFVKPGLYRTIDWSRPPEFLEQEMRNALRRYTKRKKFSDLLVKVWLKNGEEKWVLILLEVQSYFDSLFCERVFDYFCLLVNKYQTKDIIIFALYTGEHVPKVFDHYKHKIPGTSFRLNFTAVKATKQKEEKLEKSKNPVALAFLANIWRIRSKDNPQEREEKTLRLEEILRKRTYDSDSFYEICNFIGELLNLSSHREKQFVMKASTTSRKRKPEPILPLMHQKKDKWFIDAIYESYYGYSPPALKEEKEKLELKVQQAEQQKQQAELEKQQAELEKQQARQEVQQTKSMLMHAYSKDFGWDAAKIAAHLGVDVKEVEKILAPKRRKPTA